MKNNVRRGRAAVAIATSLVAFGLFGSSVCGVAVAQEVIAEAGRTGWHWRVTPYLWGSDIKTDITFPGGQEIGGTARFDDILDKLELGGMVHVEGQRGTWGMFFDATYLSLSDDAIRGPITVDSELDTGLYELALTYTPGGSRGPFTAFAGARIVDLSLELTFTAAVFPEPIRRTSDKSFTDFMVGGRYVHSFNDHWILSFRGDIGAGDTESSWNALAAIGWRFGSDLDNAVMLGWRHMDAEVEEEGRQTDVTFDGPVVGVLFSF